LLPPAFLPLPPSRLRPLIKSYPPSRLPDLHRKDNNLFPLPSSSDPVFNTSPIFSPFCARTIEHLPSKDFRQVRLVNTPPSVSLFVFCSGPLSAIPPPFPPSFSPSALHSSSGSPESKQDFRSLCEYCPVPSPQLPLASRRISLLLLHPSPLPPPHRSLRLIRSGNARFSPPSLNKGDRVLVVPRRS